MTAAKIVGLISAGLGAVGTLLLYLGSFTYEAPFGYSNKEMVDALRERNRKRQLLQRAGLGLLMLSFILGGVSVIVG